MDAVRRVLFVECCPPPNDPTVSFTDVAEELQDVERHILEVRVVKHPSLLDLQRSLDDFKPQLLYCTGGFSPYGDALNARHDPLSFSEIDSDGQPCTLTDAADFIPVLQNYRFETIYMDAPLNANQVAQLGVAQCCANLVYWPSEGQMCSAVASQFAHCFFAMRRNLSVSFSEAYALASHSVQLLCDNILKERPQIQLLPSYCSQEEPMLPHCSSVPLEIIPEVQFLEDDVPDIDGAPGPALGRPLGFDSPCSSRPLSGPSLSRPRFSRNCRDTTQSSQADHSSPLSPSWSAVGLQNQPLSPDGTGKQERYPQPPPARAKPPSGGYGQNGDMDIDLVDSLDNDSDYEIELDPEYDMHSKIGHDPVRIQMPDIASMNYHSTRPPLPRCTEAEFYDDLVMFLEAHRGKAIDRKKFPEPILNGVQLDLFNLYKEVVSRGGFRVGNGINWKGQVFPKMRNWTAKHKMTGVGNSLKKHYQNYLLEYEMVHPKDLKGDGCWLCGSNDDSGTDWIECEHCERWIHFACDRRPSLGTFKEYATGDGGRPYYCPECGHLANQS